MSPIRNISPTRSRKQRGSLLLLVVLSTAFAACNKNGTPPGTASLTLAHAIAGARPLITNFNGRQPIPYSLANQIRYGVFNPYNTLGVYPGNQVLALYQYPDTLEKDAPLLELQLHLPVNSIHTLFLTGSETAPDTLMIRDSLPVFRPADSLMAIRFVNLSPGSAPVSVNIRGKSAGSEVPQLSYKNITAFQEYSVKLAPEDYEFEFRDAVTGTLIASYPMPGSNQTSNQVNIWRNHHFTLALIGLGGGAGGEAPAILRINHF